MNRAQTGQRGEAAAAKFYLDRGCRLLTHNFHTRMGELDVVVQEPDGTVVICEVKTRAEGSLTTPAEAVNRAKQRRLIRAAEAYLQRTGLSEAPVRFDVAEVNPLDSGRWMVHIIFLREERSGGKCTGRARGSATAAQGRVARPVPKKERRYAVLQYQRHES